MSVVIFHNPNCSSSRSAVAAAEELGVVAEIVQYLKHAPSKVELEALVGQLEDPVTDLVRRDSHFASLGLTDADVETAVQVVAVLVEHPRLLQRPVVVSGGRAIIGRPKDRVVPFLRSARA